MTSPIQIPNLRPTDVVREPGLDQPQDQMSKLAQLLMLKGHLALETEKFQAEEQDRKQKKADLAQASATLSQLFSDPNVATPGGLAGAIGKAAGPLTQAGAGSEAGTLLRELPGLQQQGRALSTQSALGLAINEFAQGDVRDPGHQAEFLQHVMTISPGHMQQASEMLKPLQSTIAFHMVPNVGLWAGPVQGTPDEIRRQGRIIVEGSGTDPAAKQRQSNAAALALQRMSNLEHTLATDKMANIEPTAAAGAENLGESKIAKAVVGAAGYFGIGAGTPEAIAQGKRSPAQQNWQRDADGFSHAYFIWVGGTPRSNYLYNNIRGSFFPGAGASDEARAQALKELRSVRPLLLASLQGKKVDMTQLPFFNEIQSAEAQAGGAGQPAPGEGPPPVSANDLLQGVPK